MNLSSDNSKQQQNYSENEIDSPDRPLSPVLSTGKKSKLFAFGNRLRKRTSKINLCTRYADSTGQSDCVANEIGSGDNEKNAKTICTKPDTCNETNNTIEDRVRNIKGIDDKRKAFYNTLCSIPVSDRTSNTLNSSDKFCFKKPISPVCVKRKSTNCINNFSAKGADTSLKVTVPLQSASILGSPSNKLQGFQTGSGKKITVCDNSVKRIANIFTEILNEGLITTDTETNVCKNLIQKYDTKLKPAGFQSASGKQINISKGALEHANNLFSNQSFDDLQGNMFSDTQFLCNTLQKTNDKQKIIGDTVTETSVASEIQASVNKHSEGTKHATSSVHESAGFSQDSDFTDTQMNFAVDTVESAINVKAKSNSEDSECNYYIGGENKALQQEIMELQQLLKDTEPELPKRKLHFSREELKSQVDFALFSQEGDSYLANFTQNVVPNSTENVTSNNNISDITVKSTLPIQVINDASLHCKNMLNIINLVQKNIELHTDEETNKAEFAGYSNFDVEFANNKVQTCKKLIDDLSNKVYDDDVYCFGFTEESKKFSLRCFQNELDCIIDMDNALHKDVVNTSKTYGDRHNEEKQKNASSLDKSCDDLITLFKNKKRTSNNKLLPPKKRMKYTSSSSDNETNDSLSIDKNNIAYGFIDKKKYTEMWCNSSFGDGSDNLCTDANGRENKHNLDLQEDTRVPKNISQTTNYLKLSKMTKPHRKITNNQIKHDSKVGTPISAMSGFCFKSASGKNISLSKDSLNKAQQLFDDISNESSEKTITFKNRLPHSPEITEVIEDEKNISNRSLVALGFKSASSKPITISRSAIARAEKMFDSIDEKINLTHMQKYEDSTENICDKIKKSSRKVQETDEQIAGPSRPNLGTNDVNFGFQSASGKKLAASKVSLMKAQKLFVKANQSKLEDIQESCPTEHTFSEVQNLSSSNSNSASKSATKKRLGVSSCKQINVPSFKLAKAKQLFADTDELTDISIRRPIDTSTPVKFFPSITTEKGVEGPSTPKTFGVLHNQSAESSKNSNTLVRFGRNFISESSTSPILIHKETKGDVDCWLKNVKDECEFMECQLKILHRRKEALLKQKIALDVKLTNHQGQCEGILYKKKNSRNRIMLQDFVQHVKPGEADASNINERILKITPQNAEYVHFNCNSSSCDVVRTLDNAVVIPNRANAIGISEIEVAFKTMPGVHPSLIPDGWIRNHYKWIIWKLASLERAFPVKCADCLNVENVMQQLKYRYDREIDRAERSAIRRILEKDDAVQKRIVLCVSNIFKVSSDVYELELCDGWYSVRTVIDVPLCDQIRKCKIRIGTKLIIQGAELLNCEGCHPLEAPEPLRMKINYNSSRRTVWHAKMGYQMCPGPLLISLKSVHSKGGIVGHLRVHITRVYPLRFMEKQDDAITWRNEKAEQKRARQWESERLTRIEEIRHKIEKEYEKQVSQEAKQSRTRNIKKNEIPKITCSKVLHELVTNSDDPDSILELLSPSQRSSVLEFNRRTSEEQQQSLSKKVMDAVASAKLVKRDVIPILKVAVVDASVCDEKATIFNIWRPSNDVLALIKEGTTLSVYNVVPKNDGTLGSVNKTKFELAFSLASQYTKMARQVLPIALTLQPFFSPFLNEFDTVGVVAKICIDLNIQYLWLADFKQRLLLIKLNDGPNCCLLFDGLQPGDVVVGSNLILQESQNSFGLAVANHYTMITKYPQHKSLKEGLQVFKNELPKDMDEFLSNCNEKIDVCVTKLDFIHSLTNRSYSKTLLAQTTSLSITDILNETGEDENVLTSQLTAIDIAMSMIDTDKLCKE